TKFQPSQAILLKMREDAPPLNLTEEMPPPFPTKANYLIHPVR
ncbi:colanic acid biosynthesis lipoprotein YpdI, partial [Escherichia coli]